MTARTLVHGLPILIAFQLALGAVNAYQEHPQLTGIAAFLTLWTPLPTAIGWVLARLALLQPEQPRQPLHRAAVLFSSYVVSAAWLLGPVIGAVAGPTNPDTAGHMGHFLWPPLLCVVGAILYGVSFWTLVLTRGRHAA